MLYRRAPSPLKMWRNRCKSGVRTPHLLSTALPRKCGLIANVSKLKDFILKYFPIFFSKVKNLAQQLKQKNQWLLLDLDIAIQLSTILSIPYYSVTLRSGIGCHISFLFILWVWYGVIKRSMKYFLQLCLYQKCQKERAVSLKESGSEHISWWK